MIVKTNSHCLQNILDRHGGGKKGFRRYCLNCSKIRTAKRRTQTCKVKNCQNLVWVLSKGLCGKHYKRLRVYGDINYITPKEVMARHSREAKLKVKKAKKNTYKKLYGRHEHRVVAEQKLGRSLKTGEVVHHIDEIRHNNAPENLMLFPSQKEHAAFHGKKRKIKEAAT